MYASLEGLLRHVPAAAGKSAHQCTPETCEMSLGPVPRCKATQQAHVCMPLGECKYVVQASDGTHVCRLTGLVVELGFRDVPVYSIPSTQAERTTRFSFKEMLEINRRPPVQDRDRKLRQECYVAFEQAVRVLALQTGLGDTGRILQMYPRILALRRQHQAHSRSQTGAPPVQDMPLTFRTFALACMYEAIQGRPPSLPRDEDLSADLLLLLPDKNKAVVFPALLGVRISHITRARAEIAAMNAAMLGLQHILPGCTHKHVLV
jgi:hypothetical protein